MTSTALGRLCHAGALSVALTSALLATPAFADGGNGAGDPLLVRLENIIGGADSITGTGGNGAYANTQDDGNFDGGNSAGGGGAGATGGQGGTDTRGGTAAGGSSRGAAGANGFAGGGGGGGAHGWIDSVLPGVTATGGRGGNGGDAVDPVAFSAGAGGGGGAGGYGVVFTGMAGTLSTNVTGGNGGSGGDATNTSWFVNYGGNGGSGGVGLYVVNAATLILNAQVTGGQGGAGGSASVDASMIGGSPTSQAGQGGAGGVGVFAQSGADLAINAAVAGGAGGAGGSASGLSGAQRSTGGNAGDGGSGVTTQSSALTINAAVTGGNGGAGGSATIEIIAKGGNGGAGGAGVSALSGTVTINNVVTGGNGGAGGSASGGNGGSHQGGTGGDGGAGVRAQSGTVVTVNGQVIGGNGAAHGSGADSLVANGAGGIGVTGSDITVVNNGSISGGLASDGNTRANAVTFTGGSNVYEMWAGSSVTGNVVNDTSAGSVAKFVLGGDANGSFNVSTIGSSQTYQGFSSFEKNGASTWTLTGTQSAVTNWSLLDGTLSISNVSALGNSVSSLNFNGGTLRFTGASAASLDNTITWGVHGGGFDVSDAAGTLIVSGSMSGTGGLTKLGAGTLNLLGTSDYTGATSVNAGTLAAGSASAFSSSSAYTVASGARLELNGYGQTIGSLAGAGSVALGAQMLTTGGDNTSTLFSGVIDGNGGLTKTGTGAMTLSGMNTYTGATIINDGALVVNGSIASSSLTTVNTGAILTGSGAAGAVQVNAGGTFASGGGTPGSSMTVASLAFQSGAFYVVNLNPTTSSFANVTGSATLSGATVAANFANGNYLSKRYTIVSAGNIVGAFDPTMVPTNFPANVHSALSYDPTHAYLDLTLDFTPPPSGGALGGNQSKVGNAITNFFNSTGGIPMAFSGLTPQGLTQVSGEIGGSAQGTSAQASTQFMTIMSDPTAAGRGGAGGGAGASGYADEAMAYAAKRSNNPRDAFASFTKAPPVAFVQRWSTWAMGYGGSQTTDGNAAAGTNTSSSNIYGVAVGADYSFSPDTVAGFALSGGGTNYSVVNGGTGRSDMFQLGAFVRHNIGATYLTASAAYGWQDVTTDRYVTVAGVDHLKAEFNTHSYSGRLELGHRFLQPWFGGLGVSPYAAVQVTAFELPAYAEQAVTGTNTFALAYGANTSTATRSELGVRTDKSYALDGAVLTLRGRAAWAHDFNPNSAVSATFQTLPGASFVVNGAALAPDAALTTASAEVSWMNGWSVAGTFEGEFSNVTRSYAGKGVVRYNW